MLCGFCCEWCRFLLWMMPSCPILPSSHQSTQVFWFQVSSIQYTEKQWTIMRWADQAKTWRKLPCKQSWFLQFFALRVDNSQEFPIYQFNEGRSIVWDKVNAWVVHCKVDSCLITTLDSLWDASFVAQKPSARPLPIVFLFRNHEYCKAMPTWQPMGSPRQNTVGSIFCFLSSES